MCALSSLWVLVETGCQFLMYSPSKDGPANFNTRRDIAMLVRVPLAQCCQIPAFCLLGRREKSPTPIREFLSFAN